MTILIVFNRNPYDGTDVTWNGLRLAGQLLDAGQQVRGQRQGVDISGE